tara:strand:+ start:201 stop:1286 length:1086 start_codon:yes stop_codon:yes gene_type:complete
MKLLDLFSGIGGFHKGLERAGFKFDWVGYSDIDKYAQQVYQYNFKTAEKLGNVTAIQPRDLPEDIDILCGGFPCQAFSMAGHRKGFDDTRGTLFFEIARLLRYFRELGKPIPYFILENVKGLLNHDSGLTFNTIYRVLTDLDYTVECQLLNTKWFLPQNRERIYIVGHLGDKRSGSKIFPITESFQQSNKLREENKTNKHTGTLIAGYARIPNDGTYIADYRTDEGIRIRKDNNAPCLTSSATSETEPSRMGGLVMHSTQPRSGDPTKGGTGPLSRDDGNTYCLDTGNSQAIEIKSSMRRLTPLECERLQGFPDHWTMKGADGDKIVDISDSQRYKQCGNAVSVPVVQAVGLKIKELINES